MKNLIFKITCLLLLAMSCNISEAQSFSASYEYDANGNRVKAVVIYLNRAKSGQIELDKIVNDSTTIYSSNLPLSGWDEGYKDSLQNFTTLIYPNPTNEKILIQFSDLNTEQLSNPENFIKMWDMQGRVILIISNIEFYNLIDLHRFPNGTYLLKVKVMNNLKEYRIIKN